MAFAELKSINSGLINMQTVSKVFQLYHPSEHYGFTLEGVSWHGQSRSIWTVDSLQCFHDTD